MTRRPRAIDEADIASEQEEFFRNEALWRFSHSHRKPASGICGNCGERCSGEYCDKNCREDDERRSRHARKTRIQP